MKIEFTENEFIAAFSLTPETPKEVAMLYRMVQNANSNKPELYLSFGETDKSDVWANVCIRKMKPKSNRYRTSISNK